MTNHASSAVHRTDWIAQPEITGALVVVRRGLLCKFEPVLKESRAAKAGEIMKKRWPAWQRQYVESVENFAGLAPGEFAVSTGEHLRYRYDGKTPMIDLPRLRTVKGVPYLCDLRNCVALCTDQYSSKVWTRIGVPIESGGCAKDELRTLTKLYRSQAAEVGEWFFEQFFEMTASAYSGTRRIRDEAVLEVTTVGLRSEECLGEEEADAWLFDGDSVNLANDELCDYLAAAADLDVETLRRRGREFDWMAVSATTLSGNGLLVSRRVPYMSRTIGNVVQIVGIGLDDSGRGDMANDVALKLSRIIANWI